MCERPRDRAWLDYQEEIGQRYTDRKNVPDEVDSVPMVSLRYMVALIYPITATIREFLAARGHGSADIDGMFHAWFKSVVLTVVLWSRRRIGKRLCGRCLQGRMNESP